MSYDPSHRMPPRQERWPQATPAQGWPAYRDSEEEQADRLDAYAAADGSQRQAGSQHAARGSGDRGHQSAVATAAFPATGNGYGTADGYSSAGYGDARDGYDRTPDHGYGSDQYGAPGNGYGGANGYAGAANGYAGAANGYAGTAGGYAGAPDDFAGAPGGYGSGDRGYAGNDHGYGSTSNGYAGTSNGYAGTSNGYAGNGYADTVDGYAGGFEGVTDGFDGAVDGYTGDDNGYTRGDIGYGQAADEYVGDGNGYDWNQTGYDGTAPGFAGAQDGFAGAQDGFAGGAYLGPGSYTEPGLADPAFGRDLLLTAPDAGVYPDNWQAEQEQRREAGRRGPMVGAVAEVLATGVVIGVSTLAAALFRSPTSPVSALGTVFIDRTPAALRNVALQHFGAQGRTVLLLGMYATFAVVAIVIGGLAQRAIAVGVAGIAAFTLVSAFATITRPAGHVGDVTPAIVGGIAGVAALLWLYRASAPAQGIAPLRPTRGGARRRTR